MRPTLRVFAILLAATLSGQNITHSGIHPEDIDTTCKPCTDFWRYVNGTWLDKNPIPAHMSSWGTFTVLAEANQERMRTILDAAAADANAKPESDKRRMGDLYTSCMDAAGIDARGLAPLEPDFDRIAAIRSVHDLNAAFAWFQGIARPFGTTNGAVVAPFRLIAGQDPKNPNRVIARIVERDAPGRTGTSIFSLPDRDYYLKTDQKSHDIRDAFLAHAAKMLELAGASHDDAARQAKTVLRFETALAAHVMTIAEKRNPDNTWHPFDLAGLHSLAPNIDWSLVLHEAGIPESTTINVTEPELIKEVNAQIQATPLDDWKAWLHWRALQLAAPYLTKPIAEESFHFESTVLLGVKEPRPRWQSCAAIVDNDLSDALGQAYTAKYFPPSAKRRMSELVENLRAAFREELQNSAWMEAATKKSALAKLAALKVQIGYPDRWKSYAGLEIRPKTYFENVRATWAFADRYDFAQIGRPPDHLDWAMTAPTVNAYSSVADVKVVFPAGILQPPYFDMQADDAANYGAIGAVIGHEMGHQFDDGGSKYDATGALDNWWTDADRKKFDARTSCVVDQFNTLDVGDGLHHNGRQILGEALGDLGGLSIAYQAWKHSLAGKPTPPEMDGFTAEQRFFIAYARVWGTQYRPEALRMQLNTNNHPVSQYRAIATLQNMPEFHRAFHCKEGDAMVRPGAQQCRLW